MPILEREYWKSKTTMSDLIQRIMNLIHQEVNPFSPANSTVFQLYKEDQKKYD
jgi:ubiquitin-protein ligase